MQLTDNRSRDELYERAATDHGSAIERLARSYEADREKRRDLLQEIHLALWRSLATFRAQCSLRTWIYRVAHNVAASHVERQRRSRPLLTLDEIGALTSGESDVEATLHHQRSIAQLQALIQQLQTLDREVIVLYLEGVDAASIGEITGLSPTNVATKIHRIKKILAAKFRKGEGDGKE
jgi:RNA polymerase sigma-70 factor (ECF subfamily)